MTAGTWNPTIEQGGTWRRELTWRGTNGAVIATAGATARMQLRRRPGEPVLLELSTANGRIVLSDAAPNIVLEVDAEGTAGCAWPEHEPAAYDLVITLGTRVVPLLTGIVWLREAVTIEEEDAA